eukprot:TRINITY_DN25474_c0_g1_i1.p1 TRINITY_DN25474_c0_g1~~TRINITY_DN25474_c0_g1_i1.p1  ORF type:complete len:111 (+),score=10.25 TRINITY_DN25474_c0_g1_i1:10-342(+)
MIRRTPRSTQSRSSAASDVYKRQVKRRSLPRIETGTNNRWMIHSNGTVEGSDAISDHSLEIRNAELEIEFNPLHDDLTFFCKGKSFYLKVEAQPDLVPGFYLMDSSVELL